MKNPLNLNLRKIGRELLEAHDKTRFEKLKTKPQHSCGRLHCHQSTGAHGGTSVVEGKHVHPIDSCLWHGGYYPPLGSEWNVKKAQAEYVNLSRLKRLGITYDPLKADEFKPLDLNAENLSPKIVNNLIRIIRNHVD